MAHLKSVLPTLLFWRAEALSEPSRTSKTELLAKIVNQFVPNAPFLYFQGKSALETNGLTSRSR